jgi:uncharacterized protein GlcG (DUF336 family)
MRLTIKTSGRSAATICRGPEVCKNPESSGRNREANVRAHFHESSKEVYDMSPIAKLFAGCALAAMLVSPAGAQGVLTQKNVSLELAQTIANAALAQCRSMGYKIAVSVVDRDGLPVILMYDDGAGLNTREGSDRKAYTAAAFHSPSAAFVKRMHDNPESAGSIQYSRVLALAGGLPIKVGNDTIGAVGVSGTPGKDDVCSQAGIDKVADQLK